MVICGTEGLGRWGLGQGGEVGHLLALRGQGEALGRGLGRRVGQPRRAVEVGEHGHLPVRRERGLGAEHDLAGPVDEDRLQVVDEVDGPHALDAGARAGPAVPPRPSVPLPVFPVAKPRPVVADAGGWGTAGRRPSAWPGPGLAARGTTTASGGDAHGGERGAEARRHADPAARGRAAVRPPCSRSGGAVGGDHEGRAHTARSDRRPGGGRPASSTARCSRTARRSARAPPARPAPRRLLPGPQGPRQHGHEPGAGGDAQHHPGGGRDRGGMRADDGPGGVERRDERPPGGGGGECRGRWRTRAGPRRWRAPPPPRPRP